MFHARSDGDVHRGISVSVSLVPTVWTLEESFTSNAFCSAPTTYMRSPFWIDCNHEPSVLPSHRFERRSELAVGHSFGFAVAKAIGRLRVCSFATTAENVMPT